MPCGGVGHTIELPWPPAALRPNASARGNWRRYFNAAKQYRSDCLILAKAQRPAPIGDNRTLSIEFRPPDKRRRDLDNMLSAFKAGLDAVAETLGCDDSVFALLISKGAPVKGGAVIVEVRP